MPGYLTDHGYRHDIFISYAHGPAFGDVAPLRDWSRQYHELLVANLRLMDIDPISVYLDGNRDRDDAIDPLDELGAQLADAVGGSAMLQVHLSNRYLRSEWCKRELAAWAESLPGKAGAKDRRISVTRLMDTGQAPWPDLLQPGGNQLPGVAYFTPGEDGPWGLNLDFEGKAPNDEFARAILLEVGAIRKRLQELRDELLKQAAAKSQLRNLEGPGQKTIYLHGREAQRREWDATRRELGTLNVEIRPSGPAPDDDDPVRWDKLSNVASRCDAMLMVGADRFELDDDLDLVGRERRALIQARFSRYLPCAVVDRANLRSEAFVRAASRRDVAWLNGQGANWQNQVQAWLADSTAATADKYGLPA